MTIKEIQSALNAFGYNLVVDGVKGPKTRAAIKDFQKNHGLVVDGIVGPKTIAALRSKSGLKFTLPVGAARVSSDFAAHQKRGSQLPGIDYAVAVGTAVHASESGVVEVADSVDNSASGKYIRVLHSNGFKSYYLHLSKVSVSIGQRINKGDVIGLSGNTGTSTGPHLHFTIMHNGVCVNPASYL